MHPKQHGYVVTKVTLHPKQHHYVGINVTSHHKQHDHMFYYKQYPFFVLDLAVFLLNTATHSK